MRCIGQFWIDPARVEPIYVREAIIDLLFCRSTPCVLARSSLHRIWHSRSPEWARRRSDWLIAREVPGIPAID